MSLCDNADIGLVAPKRNQGTHPHPHLSLQLLRNGIGEEAVKRHGEDNVGKQAINLEIISSRDLPSVIVCIDILKVLELTRLASSKVVGEAHFEVLDDSDTSTKVEAQVSISQTIVAHLGFVPLLAHGEAKLWTTAK